MPPVEVVFYRDVDGSVPALTWLDEINDRDARIDDKLQVKLERLSEEGHALRRPEADYLRDDIYELRVKFGSVNYRLLYFFFERQVAVVSHGLTKEAEVPKREVDLAIKRRQLFLKNPDERQHHEEIGDEDE
jgi:phage-related protein